MTILCPQSGKLHLYYKLLGLSSFLLQYQTHLFHHVSNVNQHQGSDRCASIEPKSHEPEAVTKTCTPDRQDRHWARFHHKSALGCFLGEAWQRALALDRIMEPSAPHVFPNTAIMGYVPMLHDPGCFPVLFHQLHPYGLVTLWK